MRTAQSQGHGRANRGGPARDGFTLIELLVVIAIISLLVSILLPSLGKAKELATAVVCGTQLRNIGNGLVMYASESDGFLPMPLVVGSTIYGTGLLIDYGSGPGGFGKLVDQGIVDDWKLFVCPGVRNSAYWSSVLPEWSPYSMRIDPPNIQTGPGWLLDPASWTMPTEGTWWLAADCYFGGGNHQGSSGQGQNVLFNGGYVEWDMFEEGVPRAYALMNALYDRP